MKRNSRILLLSLAGETIKITGVPLALALQLPIGKTEAGRRSLVYFLAKSGQIWLERHHNQLHIGLTDQGRRQLNAQFPAYSVNRTEAPGWQLLLLKMAPKNDPHFRSLAVLCTKHRALRLTRGVYAYPGAFPFDLEQQLMTLYSERNIARCTVNDWVSGLDRPVIVSYYDIEHLSVIYSSISRELSQLLTPITANKDFIYRTIINITSVIDRLESALKVDCGLVYQYFPETPIVTDLVNQIGQVLHSLHEPE